MYDNDNNGDNKGPSFLEALNHITDVVPLINHLLYGLSNINETDLVGFQAAWPTIEANRRQRIMKKLMNIAEEDFLVDFYPIFLFGLNDKDIVVQALAIEGLWQEENPALIPLFVHLLKEGKTPLIRSKSATALGGYIYLGELEEIDEAQFMMAEQALLSTIGNEDEDTEVVRRAIEAIAFSSQDGVDKIIERAYYHENKLMQISAIFAMGRSYNPKRWAKLVMAELTNPDDRIRFEATRACGSLELKTSIDKLIQLIAEEIDAEVLQNAICSLGQIGGLKAQEALQLLLEHDDEIIRDAAEDALDELLLLGSHIDDLLDIDLLDEAFDDEFDDGFDDASDYLTYQLN